MKWPEGPETQLGARGAAALNKYWCWCPGICHLAQPAAQLGQRRAGGQGCTAGSEGTQGERGGDLLRGRSSDTLWHPNEGVCSIRAGSSHPRALGWHPAPAPTASRGAAHPRGMSPWAGARVKLCHGCITEPLSSKSQRAECALGSAARFAASRRRAPLLLQRASWSALMPWAEITNFALLPPIVHPGSSLAEVGEHGEGTRLLGTAQLSAPSPQLPPAPAAPRTGLNAAAFCPREPFLVCGEKETPAGTSGTKAHPPPNQHHGRTAQTEAPATCKSPGRWEVSRGPLGCPHPPAGSSPQGTSPADALPAPLSPQPCSHPAALTWRFPARGTLQAL